MILLDTIDRRLLSLVRKRQKHASEIARTLALPRTSVAYRLRRLAQFKYVESKIHGRKVVWSISRAPAHSKELFKTYSGRDFYECYKCLYTLSKEEVIFAVQGSEAGASQLRVVPHYFIEEIHRIFKQRKIRMHAIANKKILGTFATLHDTLRESHIGRIQGIKFVDQLLISEGEVFVSKNFIIMVNPKRQRALVMKEKEIVSLLYELMTIFFAFSDQLETFDLNAYLGRLSDDSGNE